MFQLKTKIRLFAICTHLNTHRITKENWIKYDFCARNQELCQAEPRKMNRKDILLIFFSTKMRSKHTLHVTCDTIMMIWKHKKHHPWYQVIAFVFFFSKKKKQTVCTQGFSAAGTGESRGSWAGCFRCAASTRTSGRRSRADTRPESAAPSIGGEKEKNRNISIQSPKACLCFWCVTF